MRATDLHDFIKGLRLGVEGCVQAPHRRQQLRRDRERASDMHRGRKAIIRGLTIVDVVIGMHGLLGATPLAQLFIRAIGDHFVDVHVGLGARTRLPDDQWKLIVEFSVDHLFRSFHDGFRDLRLDQTLGGVHLRGGLLHARERMQDLNRHALPADRKILQ